MNGESVQKSPLLPFKIRGGAKFIAGLQVDAALTHSQIKNIHPSDTKAAPQSSRDAGDAFKGQL